MSRKTMEASLQRFAKGIRKKLSLHEKSVADKQADKAAVKKTDPEVEIRAKMRARRFGKRN